MDSPERLIVKKTSAICNYCALPPDIITVTPTGMSDRNCIFSAALGGYFVADVVQYFNDISFDVPYLYPCRWDYTFSGTYGTVYVYSDDECSSLIDTINYDQTQIYITIGSSYIFLGIRIKKTGVAEGEIYLGKDSYDITDCLPADKNVARTASAHGLQYTTGGSAGVVEKV
jgi:hypothetical protein